MQYRAVGTHRRMALSGVSNGRFHDRDGFRTQNSDEIPPDLD
jgi:hypothetical protein